MENKEIDMMCSEDFMTKITDKLRSFEIEYKYTIIEILIN
jgi:hypothetical protein